VRAETELHATAHAAEPSEPAETLSR